jgi:tryptophan synthase alpha chain
MTSQNQIRLMSHLVAGYPNLDVSLEVADALVRGGSTFLEIQLAFSDPSADGPAIQNACAHALSNGFSTQKGLAFIGEVHQRHPEIPLFLMTYASLAYTPGIENFIKEAKKVGVTGVIIPDLPFDQDEGLTAACKKYGMENIPVAAPSMTPERLNKMIDAKFTYIYAALRAGITGSETTIDSQTLQFLDAFSKGSSKILGGFGIRSGSQAKQLANHVYAVVAGSVFVHEITTHYNPQNENESKMKIASAVEAKAKEITSL